MTGRQVREARRLLGWSLVRLSALCQINPETIRIFEARNVMPQSMYNRTNPVDRIAVMRTTLEAAGVEFPDGDALGVKLRKAEA